jgi:predicted MFS family arabinose efflux permease
MLAALCVASFLAALNFFAPTPFYPEMARDLQTTVPLLGQVMTIMVLISAALGLVIGPLADRYGYRQPLLVGLGAVTFTLLGTSLAPNYPVLLGISVAGGLGDALVFALPLAIAGTAFSGEARRRAIGWTTASLSSASIAGAPLLTAIGGLTSWRVALGVAALVGAAASWFVATTLPPDTQRPDTPLRARSLAAAYAPLLRHTPSLRLFGLTALRGAWWIGLLTYLGAFLGTAMGLSTGSIGIVYALTGGAYAAGSIVTGRWARLSSPAAIALGSIVGGGLIVIILTGAAGWAGVPLLVVASVASAICGVGVVALLAAESPAGAGVTMVLNGSILNLGTAGGALLGGILISLGGYAALGIGLGLTALVAAALAAWPGGRRSGVTQDVSC